MASKLLNIYLTFIKKSYGDNMVGSIYIKMQKYNLNEITEDSNVVVKLKNMWILITTVVLLSVAIVSYQFRIEKSIDNLNVQIQQLIVMNDNSHALIQMKLGEMDTKYRMAVLKNQLKSTLVYVQNHNKQLSPQEEIDFRQNLTRILED